MYVEVTQNPGIFMTLAVRWRSIPRRHAMRSGMRSGGSTPTNLSGKSARSTHWSIGPFSSSAFSSACWASSARCAAAGRHGSLGPRRAVGAATRERNQRPGRRWRDAVRCRRARPAIGLLVTGIGLALGLPAAALAATFMRTLLYQVGAIDLLDVHRGRGATHECFGGGVRGPGAEGDEARSGTAAERMTIDSSRGASRAEADPVGVVRFRLHGQPSCPPSTRSPSLSSKTARSSRRQLRSANFEVRAFSYLRAYAPIAVCGRLVAGCRRPCDAARGPSRDGTRHGSATRACARRGRPPAPAAARRTARL